MPQEDQQQSLIGERSDDCIALLVLENRGVERTVKGRFAETLRLRDESRDACREVLCVQSRRGKTLNEKSVFSQHKNGINSRTLA